MHLFSNHLLLIVIVYLLFLRSPAVFTMRIINKNTERSFIDYTYAFQNLRLKDLFEQPGKLVLVRKRIILNLSGWNNNTVYSNRNDHEESMCLLTCHN